MKMSESKYWKREEIIGSLVVDLNGFIVGYVKDIIINPPNKVSLRIYKIKEEIKTIIDFDALHSLLIQKIKKRFGKKTIKDLYEEIEKEMKEKVSEQVLIKYAESKNIEIPKKEIIEKIEVDMGEIAWEDIENINESIFGVCILLKKSFFEEKGAISHYVPENEIIGKMVIDKNAKIIGNVADVLYSRSGLGIKIVQKTIGSSLIPNIEELKRLLIITYASEDNLAENISSLLKIPKDLALRNDNVLEFAKRSGVEIPMKEVALEEEQEYPKIVSWKEVKTIGDVVILNKSMEEIMIST